MGEVSRYREEGQVKIEAEVGMVTLQAKDCWQPTTRSQEEARKDSSPVTSEQSSLAN
jgi:hypothetical protein